MFQSERLYGVHRGLEFPGEVWATELFSVLNRHPDVQTVNVPASWRVDIVPPSSLAAINMDDPEQALALRAAFDTNMPPTYYRPMVFRHLEFSFMVSRKGNILINFGQSTYLHREQRMANLIVEDTLGLRLPRPGRTPYFMMLGTLRDEHESREVKRRVSKMMTRYISLAPGELDVG